MSYFGLLAVAYSGPLWWALIELAVATNTNPENLHFYVTTRLGTTIFGRAGNPNARHWYRRDRYLDWHGTRLSFCRCLGHSLIEGIMMEGFEVFLFCVGLTLAGIVSKRIPSHFRCPFCGHRQPWGSGWCWGCGAKGRL